MSHQQEPVPPTAFLQLINLLPIPISVLHPISLVEQPLHRCQCRDLAQHLPDLPQRALGIQEALDVLAQVPQVPAEDFAWFHLPKGLDQPVADRLAHMWEFLDDFAVYPYKKLGVSKITNIWGVTMRCSPYKCDNVERWRVVWVAKELHQGVCDARGNFWELDSSDVDRLDENCLYSRVCACKMATGDLYTHNLWEAAMEKRTMS